MDWKREAIDKLRGYEAKKQALENIPDELQRLESSSTRIRSARTDAEPVSGGGSTREDVLLSNIVHREELERRLIEAKLWVETVDRAMSLIDDDGKKILNGFFVNRTKGYINRLCEELHLEQSHLYRRKDEALRMFTLALYGITES